MNKAASPPTNVMAYNTSCTHKEIIRDNPNQSSISMILRCFCGRHTEGCHIQAIQTAPVSNRNEMLLNLSFVKILKFLECVLYLTNREACSNSPLKKWGKTQLCLVIFPTLLSRSNCFLCALRQNRAQPRLLYLFYSN